ncbi:alpha-l-iduronidase [Anaeramoeba flamelloides]|uniref:Alpha-l-iduronidase n=1 Tax=Anaeramoeba flamelloides TaxID=1746091 RepID=A0ABQ8XCU7_9EUKA|nr:alpha-l-iduronidase [Anaeramoeba flamelloides]
MFLASCYEQRACKYQETDTIVLSEFYNADYWTFRYLKGTLSYEEGKTTTDPPGCDGGDHLCIAIKPMGYFSNEFYPENDMLIPEGSDKISLDFDIISPHSKMVKPTIIARNLENDERVSFKFTSTECPDEYFSCDDEYFFESTSISSSVSYRLVSIEFRGHLPEDDDPNKDLPIILRLNSLTAHRASSSNQYNLRIPNFIQDGTKLMNLITYTPQSSTYTFKYTVYPFLKDSQSNEIINADLGNVQKEYETTDLAFGSLNTETHFSLDDLDPGNYIIHYAMTDNGNGGTEVLSDSEPFVVLESDSFERDLFFGFNIEFFEPMQPIYKAGVQNVRLFLNWNMLVEDDGTQDLHKWPWYRNVIRNARANGMNVHVVLNKVPDYYSTYQDGDRLDASKYPTKDLVMDENNDNVVDYSDTSFYKFVVDFVTDYQDIIDTVEIANEYGLNYCETWASYTGSVAGKIYDCDENSATYKESYILEFTSGSLENREGEYLELLRAGYLAVKSVDQSIPVTAMGIAGLNLDMLERMKDYRYSDGKRMAEFCDIMNFHTYFGISPPEFTTINANTGGGNENTTLEETLQSLMDYVKEHFDDKPVWLSEFGYDDLYGTWVDGVFLRPSTRREQAVHTARAMILFKRHGIQYIFPFIASDNPNYANFFSGMGIKDSNGKGKEYMVSYHKIASNFGQTAYKETFDIDDFRLEVFEKTESNKKVALVFKKYEGNNTVSIVFKSKTDFSFSPFFHSPIKNSESRRLDLLLDWDNPVIINWSDTDVTQFDLMENIPDLPDDDDGDDGDGDDDSDGDDDKIKADDDNNTTSGGVIAAIVIVCMALVAFLCFTFISYRKNGKSAKLMFFSWKININEKVFRK